MASTKRPSTALPKSISRKPLIGWREWVGLPQLGVDQIKAKIDTGARTSAIHAFKIRALTDGGVPYVSFRLHPVQRRKTPEIECVAPVHDRRRVRSSNGEQQMRYVIRTPIILGAHEVLAEVTLADRDQLGFRMLLGRELLRTHFLIDPGRSFLAGSPQIDSAAEQMAALPSE